MATFPALEPATRSYRLGVYPITTQAAWAADAVRFRHGRRSHSLQLTLGYSLLTAAEATLIRSHWRTQAGGIDPFLLSIEAMLGHGSSDIVPAGTLWRYTSPPQESHRSGGLIDLTVELQTVAGLAIPGVGLTVSAALTAGAVTAGSIGPAAALTVTASVEAGTGTGD